MDWTYDELSDGRRIWVLTIVDSVSRVRPAFRVTRLARAIDVVMALDGAVAEFGCPQAIRLANRSQFTARALDLWAYANEVVLDFSRPGKPMVNAFGQAFNGRVRRDCPNRRWFLDIDDGRAKIGSRRHDYDTEPPHGARANRLPMDLVTSRRSRISRTQTGPDVR